MSSFLLGSDSIGAARIAALALAAFLIYVVAKVVYNLFFHPLRKFPGPLLNRATVFRSTIEMVNGRMPFHVAALHEQYGDVVRIAPNELAFASAEAWRDIYGVRSGRELPKAPDFYFPSDNIPTSIMNAPTREEHGKLRKAIAPSFSDGAMRKQEPVISGYVDLLIQRLRENCDGGKAELDMKDWYTFATFDILGKLAFSQDFGCLAASEYHPWVKLISSLANESAQIAVFMHLGLKWFVNWVSRQPSILKARAEHIKHVKEKLEARVALGSQPDIMEGWLKEKEKWNLTEDQWLLNTSQLIVAGSETTATLLCGVTYLLLTNPAALAKATEEVRTTFKSDKDITLLSVMNLPYLLACLNEALRRYPSIVGGLPRQTPEGGSTIAGKYVAEGTAVAVWQYPAYHREQNFKKPYEYHPERFLGAAEFAGDQLDVLQPFAVGPRDCIGRNLAYAEMRLIMARVLYNFDIALAGSSRDWMDRQLAYSLWLKPSLFIKMTPRVLS
ncbi:cytochrome P450 [Apiospora aurea]|uniref:Cytochrome P450 n=1 Tax=Apiospora aurea TaxID=335848 RepID=A0ABR1PTD6_9PEZI